MSIFDDVSNLVKGSIQKTIDAGEHAIDGGKKAVQHVIDGEFEKLPNDYIGTVIDTTQTLVGAKILERPFLQGDTLYLNEFLEPGKYLTSKNNRYLFCYQTDGNAVIYECDGTDKKVIWATDTYGRRTGKAIMQFDGNFVIYDSENKVIWATDQNLGIMGFIDSRLIMQDDGNLVVYDKDRPLWASKDSRGVKH